MAVGTAPTFATTGTEADKIDVRLSYRIVRLFSEGLYASPNKAVEELVANAFDAGARKVGIFLPADFHDQGATIAVLDNGIGMDAAGLKQHWLIGKSFKRAPGALPLGRQQIGKFGIGKLASYVLANRLTHISRKDGKYYSTSMDFAVVDDRGDEEVEPKNPIKISLRELTEEQAKIALKPWTEKSAFTGAGFKLFGPGSDKSWTFAILSGLKEKVHEIQRGKLAWVLRTALPLRDDFSIYYEGEKLEPSKAEKGRIRRWILGKDITELPKPAPDVEVIEDKNQPKDSGARFAFEHADIGRIWGYAEAYKELLTGGKSNELGRSYGFFVYVLGRLINVEDGHFGISPDELRHGTFGRIRVVAHMDGLDEYLQSDRERVREGPVLSDARNILRAIFNKIRPALEKADAEDEPGARLARKLADSPSSLARRPIVEMARAALDGRVKSRFIALPPATTESERDKIVEILEARAETPEAFVGGIDFVFDARRDDGIAVYDAVTARLRINGLHPFIGAFFDEFNDKQSGLPLEMFAMAEVLLESHLHQSGLKQEQIDGVMNTRDQLLRHVAQESGKRTALTIANALRNARNDENQLEVELVEAFRSLGFEAARLGGKGKADGVAKAHLSPANGKPRRYAVSLEAKSKKKADAKLKTKNFGVSTIARQRDDARCEHAIVVAQAFDHTAGKASALATEIKKDRDDSAALGTPKTITAIHVDDLARLVQLRPVKRVSLEKIREMLRTCSLPEECKAWVDGVEKLVVTAPPYEQILKAIHKQQKEFDLAAVEFSALRVELANGKPPYKVQTNEELIEICKAMALMAGGEISITDRTVELNQSPENILATIQSAAKTLLNTSH
ncbi:MAG TPA: ATP-binding protein [Rhizomicrobium sp.]|nr:ATP-binding protein [Rhizomicrobium sp.]